MKSLVKIALISLPLFMAAPTFAQISWGIGVQIGTPPPREVIVERPYADGIWVPGYYTTVGYRHEWMPGFWRHPHGYVAPERHYGYERGREFADRGRGEFRREGGRGDDRRGGREDNGRGESRDNSGRQDNRQGGRTR